MRSKILFQTMCFLLILSVACNTETKKHILTTDSIELIAEGPLFEGSNTVQGELQTPLQNLIETLKLNSDQIKNAKLTVAEIVLADSMESGLITSLTLSLASDNTEMIQVGVINPLPAGKTSFKLQVAGKQEKLAELLKQDKVYVVADAMLSKDIEASLELKCKLEFEIETK